MIGSGLVADCDCAEERAQGVRRLRAVAGEMDVRDNAKFCRTFLVNYFLCHISNFALNSSSTKVQTLRPCPTSYTSKS